MPSLTLLVCFFDSLDINDTVCPVEPGPYEVDQTVALPKEIPQGQ